MARQRYATGDVFAVPLGDDRAALGQVVGAFEGTAVYLAGFDVVVGPGEQQDLEHVAAQGDLRLLALVFDDRLRSGAWPVLGPARVRPGLPFPAFRINVGHPPVVHVVDHTGTRRRPATDLEAAVLSNRTTHSASRFEHAVQAQAGLRPWQEQYDALVPVTGMTSGDVLGPSPSPLLPAAEIHDADEGTGKHSVQLHYALQGGFYGSDEERALITQLEDALEAALEGSPLGEFDGDELGGARAVLYLYGPDARALWAGIAQAARAVPLRPAFALLRSAEGETLQKVVL